MACAVRWLAILMLFSAGNFRNRWLLYNYVVTSRQIITNIDASFSTTLPRWLIFWQLVATYINTIGSRWVSHTQLWSHSVDLYTLDSKQWLYDIFLTTHTHWLFQVVEELSVLKGCNRPAKTFLICIVKFYWSCTLYSLNLSFFLFLFLDCCMEHWQRRLEDVNRLEGVDWQRRLEDVIIICLRYGTENGYNQTVYSCLHSALLLETKISLVKLQAGVMMIATYKRVQSWRQYSIINTRIESLETFCNPCELILKILYTSSNEEPKSSLILDTEYSNFISSC